jgi:hypothetical protein
MKEIKIKLKYQITRTQRNNLIQKNHSNKSKRCKINFAISQKLSSITILIKYFLNRTVSMEIPSGKKTNTANSKISKAKKIVTINSVPLHSMRKCQKPSLYR